MKTMLAIGAVTLISFLTGCVSHPTPLGVVGPNPNGTATTATGTAGRLEVFSATEIRVAENTPADYHGYFTPHTSYEVNNESGQTVKFVRNRASFMDETPDLVRLPAGHYTVVAESGCCGLVSVPVVIEAGQTTVVHLDSNWTPSRHAAAGELVSLPDGAPVGWSSHPAAPAN